MSQLSTLSIPLKIAKGLRSALDMFDGSLLVVQKGEIITQAIIDNYPRDPPSYSILVRKEGGIDKIIRDNAASAKTCPPGASPTVGASATPLASQPPSVGRTSLEQTFPPGMAIFKEGDDSKEIYILMSGSVSIIKSGAVVAEIKHPGTFLGEMSALLDESRTATVKTIEESVFTVVPGASLLETAKQHPSILLKLCKSLAVKVNSTTQDLMALKAQQF